MVNWCGGVHGSSSPQFFSSTGYLNFLLLHSDDGVVVTRHSSPYLLLAGDLVTEAPLPLLPTIDNSWALLSRSLLLSHSPILLSSVVVSSPVAFSSSPVFSTNLFSSSPNVSLPILHLLNSPLLFRSFSSPYLLILIASVICLVSAEVKNFTGLIWNDGSPAPP